MGGWTARWGALLALVVLAGACSDGSGGGGPSADSSSTTTSTGPSEPELVDAAEISVIPQPRSVERGSGELTLSSTVELAVDDDAAAAAAATLQRRAVSDWGVEVADGGGDDALIRLVDAADDLGEEGYRLTVEPDGVLIESSAPAGFGWAVQTLLQLGPPASEAERGVALPSVAIADAPRYEWRGAMLDVSRHFFTPEEVMEVIDLAAAYKLNRFHLHLSDDQGWRIEIDAHPELTAIGGASEVGGGQGGFFTQEDYARIVDHAQQLGVVVVPEIDMPGHVNAALVSLPELNCDGQAPEPRTDMAVGYSSLCVGDEATYRWVDDVIGELAAMTPGPWIHIGGDETQATSEADYATFVPRAADIVRSHGKIPLGWEEIGAVEAAEAPLVQHWQSADAAIAAADNGSEVIMSPAPRTYLDMRYDDDSTIGNSWAGSIDTEHAYRWDPAEQVPGLDPERVVGVEAPLWTELVETPERIQLMLLPRLPALAEVAWTAQEARSWPSLRARLQVHTERWDHAGLAWTSDPSIGS